MSNKEILFIQALVVLLFTEDIFRQYFKSSLSNPVSFNRLLSLEIFNFKCGFFLLLMSSLHLLLGTIWNALIFNCSSGLCHGLTQQ